MKKTMRIISVFCLLGTAVVVQFMPESVPMHYDAMGQIDRWGSKWEQLIVPIIILVSSLLWTVIIYHYEKKAGTASNAKALGMVGMASAVMFTILQAFLLYGAWNLIGRPDAKNLRAMKREAKASLFLVNRKKLFTNEKKCRIM